MQIALVTGGSRGPGRAEALHPADAGDDVSITGNINLAAAGATLADLRAKGGGQAAALPLPGDDGGCAPPNPAGYFWLR